MKKMIMPKTLSYIQIVFIVFAAFFSGMSATSFAIENETIQPKPIIIDTDMALDDWAAILYLLNRDDISVKAIAVDGTGEAHCDLYLGNVSGAQNALGLIALAGKELENIPVACGTPIPLKGDRVFPLEWRIQADTLYGLKLPQTHRIPLKIDAAYLIASVLKNSNEKIDILALGPLTNLGVVLRDYPELKEKIGTIIIMGGAVNVPGNLNAPGAPITDNLSAEWNIFIDPYAAGIVFNSEIPIQLISLDGTNYAQVTFDFVKKFNQNVKTPSAQFISDYLGKQDDFIKSGEFYFWDSLAAVVVTNPEICTFTEYFLSVHEDDDNEYGRTEINAIGNPIQTCTYTNREEFENIFIRTVNDQKI